MSLGPTVWTVRPVTPPLFGLILFALACTNAEITSGREPPYIANVVSGAAGKALGPDGLLVLPAPAQDGPYEEISAARAEEWATLWARQFAPWSLRLLEEQHGGPIDLDTVTPCRRTFYIESAYEPLEPHLAMPYRRWFGPRWLVTLCGPEELPQIHVAVSAYSTGLQVVGGQLRRGAISGNEFLWMGVRVQRLPITSPEAAVLMVAELTGKLVTAPPHLIYALPEGPMYPKWHVAVDESVTVSDKRTGNALSTRDFYVGFVQDLRATRPTIGASAVVAAAAPEGDQPDKQGFRYAPDIENGIGERREPGPLTIEWADVVRRRDVPVRFIEIESP